MFSPCSLFCSGMTSATSLFFCTCAASTQKTIKKIQYLTVTRTLWAGKMDPSHSESDDLRFKLSVEATTLLIVPSLVRYDIDSLAFSACTPSPWCMNPGARRSDSLRRTPLFSLFLRQKHHAASSLFFTGLRWFQSRSQSATQRRRRRQTLNMKLKQDSNKKWSVGVKNQNSKEGQSVSL